MSMLQQLRSRRVKWYLPYLRRQTCSTPGHSSIMEEGTHGCVNASVKCSAVNIFR